MTQPTPRSTLSSMADPVQYPPLVVVEWEDATNVATWEALSQVPVWANDGTQVCRSVGYLVYEDDTCLVLAARVSLHTEPRQVGLFERIPKGCITGRWDAPQ